MYGGPGLVSGIAAMALYVGTGTDLCTNTFSTSISVSEIAQKYLSESTHPIGSTRLMQIITQSSLDTASMT